MTIPVDDYFPCQQRGSFWEPIFASPSTGEQQAGGEKEIWPLVFEKAWAKLHGSFEATAGGQTCDALNYLSGGIVRHIHAHVGNEVSIPRLILTSSSPHPHLILTSPSPHLLAGGVAGADLAAGGTQQARHRPRQGAQPVPLLLGGLRR